MPRGPGSVDSSKDLQRSRPFQITSMSRSEFKSPSTMSVIGRDPALNWGTGSTRMTREASKDGEAENDMRKKSLTVPRPPAAPLTYSAGRAGLECFARQFVALGSGAPLRGRFCGPSREAVMPPPAQNAATIHGSKEFRLCFNPSVGRFSTRRIGVAVPETPYRNSEKCRPARYRLRS